MSLHPLVSIVIPSLNQCNFIEETINSVLLQDYRPIELMIIDACSTDKTLTVLHKYDNVPEVKWISEPDMGHADGVNKGFLKAKGEIVAWLNADDVYFSCDVLDSVVTFFTNNPGTDVLYGDVAVISADSTLLRLFLLPPYNKGRMLRQNFISQPAVFMRKRVTEEKLSIEQVGLDYEYWIRLITMGYRFHHLNRILACDRHYPDRVSVTKRSLIEKQIELVKIKLNLPLKAGMIYAIDRSFQAVCRIRGLALLLSWSVWRGKFKTAFPMRIDSYTKLLWRQLTKAIGSNFEI